MLREKINRKATPEAGPLHYSPFPEIHVHKLSNGIPVYLVPYGQQEIVEIKLGNLCGKSYENKTGVSSLTSQMLLEGTGKRTGVEIAREFDALGAMIRPASGLEGGTVDLTALTRHIHPVLLLARQVICEPSFPESEFDKLVKRISESIALDEKQTAYVARREFGKLLFGENHPYGSALYRETLTEIEPGELGLFHSFAFDPAHLYIVISGCFDEPRLISILGEIFGELNTGEKGALLSSSGKLQPAKGSGTHIIGMQEAMQATIRMGHLGCEASNPDFYGMQVVNTILGDYFGSRLMSNLREDKGYTYGIGSGWISLKHSGLFIIQTNVGTEYVDRARSEIVREVEKLIEDGTNEEELRLVKNFTVGRMISERETPSQIADTVANSVVYNLDFSLLDEKYELIESMNPEDIKSLAVNWLHPKNLLEVIAGNLPQGQS